ncbi:GNAT family N-acetyltransferase [Gymnodinialimonas ceratoperidinii]|uniref:GNAT family N-acetyltransferase n=1 Tax=Gymnodinialimonas ceratoperidinii TaxID=2856823 RepID=A0A8F6TY95_9RHOB|nr:GNAT family N-acetyltransferase [Gymnodinialimonas ceratoperidinii]QXT41127.1 GNAT family N-acetyltransferase [Gymnodinialimonas ceratoperidinii]
MSLRVEALTDAALAAALPDLAQLRIAVFEAFPYLYQGDAAYESQYLRSYGDTPGAILVAAKDGARIVGAATGMPLAAHGDASQIDGPMPRPEDVFYCAESVLLPQYRGQGLGHRFFDLREAHARTAGFRRSAFCAVIRPEDHPARPADYRPLDPFWRARGYEPLPGVTAQFHWVDVGATQETPKTLQFWMKPL